MDDPSVRGVVLDVDSPGGEVGGLFDLAERIGSIRALNDKPLWAVALVASGIVIPAGLLDEPSLRQAHVLVADPISTGAPVLDEPSPNRVFAKHDGVWKQPTIYGRHDGEWKAVMAAWRLTGGSWQDIYKA